MLGRIDLKMRPMFFCYAVEDRDLDPSGNLCCDPMVSVWDAQSLPFEPPAYNLILEIESQHINFASVESLLLCQ